MAKLYPGYRTQLLYKIGNPAQAWDVIITP
jgi:hypothetical protein